MKQRIILSTAILFLAGQNFAQLNIQPGAKVYIQAPAIITVTGNVSTGAAILGNGTLVMNGTTLQLLQTATTSIPNLSINNTSNVKLTGNIRVNGILNFTGGKIIADNYSVFLGEMATVTGAGTGKFVETIGSGQLRKLLNTNITGYLLPVGSGSNYTPVSVTTSGPYSGAFVAVKTKPAVHPNKPASVTNYLNTYWTVLRTGITGSVSATATYTPANIVGNEATFKGFYWNGTAWVKTGVTINTAANQVMAPVTGTGGDIYAMNDFATASASQLETTNADNLYPNPTTTSSVVAFNIENSEKVRISVFDANGRLLQSKQLSLKAGYHQQKIDLSSYRNGVYEIHITSVSLNKIYRVIKQ